MTKEEILQKSVADYFRLQYPNVLFCHIANERKTTPARGAKLKKLGVKSGMPDVMVFTPKYKKSADKEIIGLDYLGLAIELKIKPNKPSENQIEVLGKLKKNGWNAKVCYSFDEAKKIIDTYLN